MKKILIVGGGTAGFISASLIKNLAKDNIDISLVYDPKNPVIGVGESTTPIFPQFLKSIGISYTDLIKNIGSTFKLGIKFSNWLENNHTYYHNFHQIDYLDDFSSDLNLVNAFGVSENIDDGGECYGDHVTNSNQILVDLDNNPVGRYALHIDGTKFSRYLESKISENIKIYKNRISEVKTNEDGIESIILESGEKLTADFYIDASGLEKILISKLDNTWIDKSSYCLMDKAIPISIPMTEKIPSYTEAFAHENGWIWKIPLAERFGLGFVYSSKFISDDDAKASFKNHLKSYHDIELELPRVIDFNPGYWNKQWNKNVVCVGLASGFVEPLESTNIHMIINQARIWFQCWNYENSIWSSEKYNKYISKMFEQCFDFIRLHYVSDRDDSNFWKHMKETTPEWVENLQKYLEKSWITDKDIFTDWDRRSGNCIFHLPSWTRVLIGLKIANSSGAKTFLKNMNLSDIALQYYDHAYNLKNDINFVTKDHREILSFIKDMQ
jgi:tryptophan halogenase